jgi:hypothetical protein
MLRDCRHPASARSHGTPPLLIVQFAKIDVHRPRNLFQPANLSFCPLLMFQRESLTVLQDNPPDSISGKPTGGDACTIHSP